MGRRPRTRVLVPFIAVGLLAVFAVVGVLSKGGASSPSLQPATGRASSALGATADVGGAAVSEAVQAVAAGTSSNSTDGTMAAAVPPASLLGVHHLLRTGDLSLLVRRGTLLSAVDRITAMTQGMGGYVMSSALGSESPGKPGPVEPLPLDSGAASSATVAPSNSAAADPYAAMTLRVPERSFDAAVKRFAALGEVQSVSTSSEDVTSQYVDLQARLRHYHAVEQRLVRFLATTGNVSQMLAVQDRIDNVQLTIEQLSAQLKSLRETTTYGTVSIFLREKGAAQAVAAGPTSTFGGTLLHSIKVLARGARVTGLIVTALLPFVVVFGGVGLVAWLVVRRVRHGRRQPVQPSLPA
jgi:hypothetical protein